MRELATAFTLVCGGALVMIRLRVEQRAVEQANHGAAAGDRGRAGGELIIVVGRDYTIEYANDAFCARRVNARGSRFAPPSALVAESPRRHCSRERYLQGPPGRPHLDQLARKDGTTFQAACAAAPIVDDAGEVTHFVAVIRDLTEELRLREQLVRGERLSALGEFVSGVAHEINNPLQSVIGTLELLLDQPHDPAVRVDLERTRIDAGRAGRIVRTLLTFVKHSSNERLLGDLNEIVKSTVSVRAYELEMAGIATREEYSPRCAGPENPRDSAGDPELIINAQQRRPPAARLSSESMIRGDASREVRERPGHPPRAAGHLERSSPPKRPRGSGLGCRLAGNANAHRARRPPATESGSCFRLTSGRGFRAVVP